MMEEPLCRYTTIHDTLTQKMSVAVACHDKLEASITRWRDHSGHALFQK